MPDGDLLQEQSQSHRLRASQGQLNHSGMLCTTGAGVVFGNMRHPFHAEFQERNSNMKGVQALLLGSQLVWCLKPAGGFKAAFVLVLIFHTLKQGSPHLKNIPDSLPLLLVLELV